MRLLLIVSLSLILLSILIGISIMGSLPSDFPSHWNIHGNVDGYMPKEIGIFFLPVLALLILTLMIYVPRFDPDHARYKEFQKAYDGLVLLITVFFMILYLVTLLWALGIQFPMNSMMAVMFGILFIGIGIFFNSVKKNWFIGIRTPWTLLSEQVWQKTHHMGFFVFCAAGLLCFGGIIFPSYAYIFIFLPLITSSCTLVLYSYLLYQHESETDQKS